ncbi:Uncharacterized protein TCM_039595 [Theobroma cacao]|uniref:Uncharacterized protein n=1 Tax=Theobroma cacao TaxID=3641 RepID=A0A061GY98_THECC|nr:Uncharacterized protein TCM_039595 [Theobroma cacao]
MTNDTNDAMHNATMQKDFATLVDNIGISRRLPQAQQSHKTSPNLSQPILTLSFIVVSPIEEEYGSRGKDVANTSQSIVSESSLQDALTSDAANSGYTQANV